MYAEENLLDCPRLLDSRLAKMKVSILLCVFTFAGPLTASETWSNSYSSSKWRKTRKQHQYSRTGSAESYQSTYYSNSYPTATSVGGYDGVPTGTGAIQPISTIVSSPSPPRNSSSVQGGAIRAPAGCHHKDNVAIGWLPGPPETIGDINSALGTTACFDGQYAQITSQGVYSDSSQQLTPSLNQLTGGKTIFIASVMPSIPLSQVDSTVAGGVADVMKQFTDKGIEVWLRFAHEVNWYVTDGTYHGSADDFQRAWATISSAVETNSQVKMFWSPNQASSSDLQAWFPTQGKVDIVGIDIYPRSQQTFGDVYGDFCKTFSTNKNIPFVIGETGAGPDLKEHWLREVASGDPNACPQYVGFSWFDYNKEADFRVVAGSGIAKQVLV